MKNGNGKADQGEKQAASKDAAKANADDKGQVFAVLQNAKAFSDMMGIMLRSKSHRHMFLSDLEWLILPALASKQFRIFHDGKQPIAFSLWATLSESVEKEFLQRGQRLRPAEWRSGENLWLIDLIGIAGLDSKIYQQLMADLLKGPLEGKELKMLMNDRKTGTRRVARLGPKAAKKDVGSAVQQMTGADG